MKFKILVFLFLLIWCFGLNVSADETYEANLNYRDSNINVYMQEKAIFYFTNSPGPSEAFHDMIRNDVGSLAGVYSSSFVSSNAINTNDMKTLLDYYMNYF